MLNILNNKVISLSDISDRTGIALNDIVVELNRRRIVPLHFGNNDYITADMFLVLFSQNNTDSFVTNPPICTADIDNLPSSELSLPQFKGWEVLRVAKATISFISKEGRKKPYMVQRRVYLADRGYKRVTKCFATRDEAEAYAAKVYREREQIVPCLSECSAILSAGIASGRTVSGNMSFYDFMIYYIRDSGKCNCTDRTQKCYTYVASSIRAVLEKFGNGSVTLEQLSDTILNKMFKEMSEKFAQSTLNKAFDFAKRTLKYAFMKKYISENIANLLEKPKSRIQSEKRQPYSDEEIQMILNAAKPNKRLYAIINIALYTGMRPSEIRALRWSDVDWNNETIHVNGAVKRHYDNPERSSYTEFIGETKSKSGIRVLPLAKSAVAALKDWHAASAGASEFILFDEHGSFMKEESFSSMWDRFVYSHRWRGKKIIMYRFRHTFCTRLLLDGKTPQMVQALMGDSTLNVIMHIYNGIKSKDVIEAARDSVNSIFRVS